MGGMNGRAMLEGRYNVALERVGTSLWRRVDGKGVGGRSWLWIWKGKGVRKPSQLVRFLRLKNK
eukprot:173929-Chlamydomonas_euryale.AAC.1